MVITMAIACVTTSIAVSIATTKILAAYYFKIVDSYELKATIEDGELKITKGETLIYHSKLKRVMCTQCALKMGGDAS